MRKYNGDDKYLHKIKMRRAVKKFSHIQENKDW